MFKMLVNKKNKRVSSLLYGKNRALSLFLCKSIVELNGQHMSDVSLTPDLRLSFKSSVSLYLCGLQATV